MQLRDELGQRLKLLASQRQELMTEAALSALEGFLASGEAPGHTMDSLQEGVQVLARHCWEVAEAFVAEGEKRLNPKEGGRK